MVLWKLGSLPINQILSNNNQMLLHTYNFFYAAVRMSDATFWFPKYICTFQGESWFAGVQSIGKFQLAVFQCTGKLQLPFSKEPVSLNFPFLKVGTVPTVELLLAVFQYTGAVPHTNTLETGK